MLALVKAGLGTAIVPESASAVRLEGICVRPLRARKPVNAELFAVWRRNDANPLMTSMVRLLRSRAPVSNAAED
jgi:DNA-binding transcriptional LysR family regulator